MFTFKRLVLASYLMLIFMLFALLIPQTAQAQPKSYNDRAYLAAVVDGIQATLPKVEDAHTVWTHIAYLPKNQVMLYRYRITSPVASVRGFAKALDAEVGRDICSRADPRQMLAAGLTVAVAFVDSTSAHVSTTIRTQADCLRTQL